jgi:IS5 family transposase
VGLNLRKVLRKLRELLWPWEKWRFIALFLAIFWSDPALRFESQERRDLLAA